MDEFAHLVAYRIINFLYVWKYLSNKPTKNEIDFHYKLVLHYHQIMARKVSRLQGGNTLAVSAKFWLPSWLSEYRSIKCTPKKIKNPSDIPPGQVAVTTNCSGDGNNLYKVGIALGVRVNTEPQLRSLARLIEGTLSQATNQTVSPLITENAICKIARHVSFNKKDGSVEFKDLKANPDFATWRLPGQPIFCFQSNPKNIILYSPTLGPSVTIESSILLSQWNEANKNCPPMCTKDIVNCKAVKEFIPTFQPFCNSNSSRTKKISADFESKVDSIKDALLLDTKREDGFKAPGNIIDVEHRNADQLLLFLTKLKSVTTKDLCPKTFMEKSSAKKSRCAKLYYSIQFQKIKNDRALTAKDWSQGRVVKPAMKEEDLDVPLDDDSQSDYYD